jgi:pSer/pThr/pTyr-binding forkhead associated (FHA) protein
MADGLVLEVVEGSQAGSRLPFAGPIEAGRSSGLPLNLDDAQVSRRHARFEPRGDGAVVSDLGSTNGTYVNEQPIHAPRLLRPGDHVRLGMTLLELRGADQPSGVRPRPPFAPVGTEVLQPVPATELAPDPREPYLALAALVDARVKRQTNVAALAMISAAGLAVLIYFGVR